jgi:hypothetical protein
MIYKMTRKQLNAIKNLLNNLIQFTQKGYGEISNVQTLVNFSMPDNIFVKYEKTYTNGGNMDYEYVITQVDKDGKLTSINDSFKTMFDRYNFISESKSFDIEDSKQYQIVD